MFKSMIYKIDGQGCYLSSYGVAMITSHVLTWNSGWWYHDRNINGLLAPEFWYGGIAMVIVELIHKGIHYRNNEVSELKRIIAQYKIDQRDNKVKSISQEDIMDITEIIDDNKLDMLDGKYLKLMSKMKILYEYVDN